MEKVEVLQPNKEALKILQEVIKQNNQIIELNKGIVSSIMHPVMVSHTEG